MSALSQEDDNRHLTALRDWKVISDELTKTFQFKDFRTAMGFVNRVGELAEEVGHHPDIDIRYNCVRLGLVTHDASGITERDFDLAARAERLV